MRKQVCWQPTTNPLPKQMDYCMHVAKINVNGSHMHGRACVVMHAANVISNANGYAYGRYAACTGTLVEYDGKGGCQPKDGSLCTGVRFL